MSETRKQHHRLCPHAGTDVDTYAFEVCICKELMEAYTEGYEAACKVAASQNGVRLSKKAQRTSRAAAEGLLPRSGTKLSAIYALIVDTPDGVTDDDLERYTGWPHQTVSSSRNVLMGRGLVKDAGVTRKNRRGLEAIVWVKSHPASQGTDDRDMATHGSDTPAPAPNPNHSGDDAIDHRTSGHSA